MKKLKKVDVILLVLLVCSIITVVVFSLPDFTIAEDETLNSLTRDAVPRLAVGIFLTVALSDTEYGYVLKPSVKRIPSSLVWSVPCFLVAVANFPFSALIKGTATIIKTEYIWLFAVKCFSIGLMEEVFFRGLLTPVFFKKFKSDKHGVLFSVICSSALFSLMHALNLFFGASPGATALQMGYTFLIGCMLAVTLFHTENIWICVFIHALFDFGGAIVSDLGEGPFQDSLFWAFTITAGIVCAVHILFSLRKIRLNMTEKNRKE